jgi:uncharacterized protein (TIGR02145 family)
MKLVTVIQFLLTTCIYSQSIENVDFRAEGKTIVVTYDFFHSKADTAINVELVFKDQKGAVVTPKTISGHLKNVKPGESNRIVWDILTDGITLSGKYKAEVSIQKYLPINLNSVKIGNQIWMTENLNVDRFQNGDIIPEAKTAEEWRAADNAKRAAWCYYDNDPANGKKYGKLYNWYAVNDKRGLVPAGWHVPDDKEWLLIDIIILGEEAGIKMKSSTGWNQNGNGTNSSGFSGLPGGSRVGNGDFVGLGYAGDWWSDSESDNTYPWKWTDGDERWVWTWSLSASVSKLERYNYDKGRGLSIRCVKDF